MASNKVLAQDGSGATELPLDSSLLLDLIGNIYDAAHSPDLWALFVRNLLGVIQCVTGGFHVHDMHSKSGSVLVDVGADPEYVRKYRDYYSSVNPWSQQYGHLVQPGQVVLGLADRDLAGSEYYEDFWRPQGYHDSLSAYLLRDESTSGALIVIRPRGAPEFEARHMKLFQLLTPHIQRALELQREFFQGVATREALAHALNHLPHGVVVVDEKRRVISTNQVAQDLLDQRDGLWLNRGELDPTERARSVSFRTLVDSCVATTFRQGTHPGGWLALPRRSRHLPLSILASPLARTPFLFQQPRPAAIILISAERVSISSTALVSLYALTPAEARLAAVLAAGKNIEEVTQQLGISTNTARTHLKRIFEKTGTTRQGDLISLLLGSVAALTHAAPRTAERTQR